jgi:hypothetical protein
LAGAIGLDYDLLRQFFDVGRGPGAQQWPFPQVSDQLLFIHNRSRRDGESALFGSQPTVTHNCTTMAPKQLYHNSSQGAHLFCQPTASMAWPPAKPSLLGSAEH